MHTLQMLAGRGWAVMLFVLAMAAWLGVQASPIWFLVIGLCAVAIVLFWKPFTGLFALVIMALLVPFQIETGTGVLLNPATLFVPVLLVIWVSHQLRKRSIRFVQSQANTPLLFFLLMSLVSLLIGNANWDPLVPRSGQFWLVQLAQWAIFAFSAGVFIVAGNLLAEEYWLYRLTVAFLIIGGVLGIAGALVGVRNLVDKTATVALIRAPFWVLLTGLAGGQLLFNPRMSLTWRTFLYLSLAVTLVYAFGQEQEAASNWVGIVGVAITLVWLRWPRLRLPTVLLVLVLAATGVLIPSIYEFAGGDFEWEQSGGSRLVLIERVVGVTMRNPITGLGPAAYRPYANQAPLLYGRAFWTAPIINSHNNYIDVFAHTGLIGLALFLWFLAEVAWLGWRLHCRYQKGFIAGYVNGMQSVLAGMVVIMMLLDWFLPFVYNVGFPGFQASVLVWLFLGGLVAIESWETGR